MSHGDRQNNKIATLPGIGYPVAPRNHAAFQRSVLSKWEAQSCRLDWFLEKLSNQEARTDLAHWYGELWGKPPRPGQVELAMAALADMGSPQARLALLEYSTENPTLSLYREVCLSYWEDVRARSR